MGVGVWERDAVQWYYYMLSVTVSVCELKVSESARAGITCARRVGRAEGGAHAHAAL